jgi:hypothetical protein
LKRLAPSGCSSRDLSAWRGDAAPTQSASWWLDRSLPDLARRGSLQACPVGSRARSEPHCDVRPSRRRAARPIVSEQHSKVVGIDTHAATHTMAVVEASTGVELDQATFPATPAGLSRAAAWASRRIGEGHAWFVVEGHRYLRRRDCQAVGAVREIGRRAGGNGQSRLPGARQIRPTGCDTDREIRPRC